MTGMDATRRDGSAAGRAQLLPAVLAGVVGAILLAALVLTGVVPALAGARPVVIRTGEGFTGPAAGALAVVRPGPPTAGDVVAVSARPGDPPDLRQVVSVSADSIALNSGDSGVVRVGIDRVDGVYLYAVPWAGALWTGVATPAGMLFVAAGLLLLVAGHELRSAHRSGSHGHPAVDGPVASHLSDL